MYAHTRIHFSLSLSLFHFSKSVAVEGLPQRSSLETTSRHHRKRHHERENAHKSIISDTKNASTDVGLYAPSANAPYHDDPAPAVQPKQCESTRMSPPISS